ncbi:hypothetical protein EK904_014130 [Melospiza melodia maxima]|nr:hypothetical protein EK904_014130 [Melospiza melodia maxima]
MKNILSKCPIPNKSLLEIWTDREDVPKTPMDSSAEDPRPVLDEQFSTSLPRLHNENPAFEDFILMQGTP